MMQCASQSEPTPQPLQDRNVMVALTGGIACYKVASLVSRLAQGGARVTVLMTDSATRFITPLTLQTLSGRPVYTSIWQAHENFDSQHIALARSADLMIIAPASANTLAKLAHGLCDDIVSLTALALPRNTPVMLAPAMNAEMWLNPITQQNISMLTRTLGYHTVGPDEGWQACRTSGPGRMAEPDDIFNHALTLLSR